MTHDERFQIQRRTRRRNCCQQFHLDAEAMAKRLCILLFLIGAAWVWKHRMSAAALAQDTLLLAPEMVFVLSHAVASYLIIGGLLLAVAMIYPFEKRAVQDQMQSIGLTNHAGLSPVLIRKTRDREHPKVTVWAFHSQSIPLALWEEKQPDIEAALDISVVKVRYADGKRRILLYSVPAQSGLPEQIPWSDTYLSAESFVLTLGEGLLGLVTINLAHVPHILLGGSTGSGKSVLLKSLLMQALKKGADVSIADFKGGVDFSPIWQERCRMCFDEQSLMALLTDLVDTLESRKQHFRAVGAANLDEYNRITGQHERRIIFGCDEVAEILDKTGRSKEEKEQLNQIESKLATIARQGRAFGIHLILATQRPDASILPGQIKNNMDCRICGRADNVLSQIILDSTDAADQIPKDAQGRFLLHDGTVFQGFLFDEQREIGKVPPPLRIELEDLHEIQ